MSAGEYDAGLELAGEEVIAEASRPRRTTVPRALLFDGRTRTFLRDASGRCKDIHPVDQKVALALLIEFGKITSAPSTGNTLRELRTLIPGDALTHDIERRLREPLAEVLAAGDIREITTPARSSGFAILLPFRGALEVTFDYENLRIPRNRDRRPARVTLTL